MPPLAGEVSLLTLFADIHYYFSHPSAKPPHHRFDKTSYVYLFQSPMQQRGRIEVANHPGTPEQDAFNGYLDTVRVERSHKHPLLFTITVDGNGAHNGSHASTPHQDMSQWHLPTLDPRNENKYMYRLHTLDIYFWTESDATLFMDSLKRVLQESQLRILDAPPAPAEHRDTMSPVVQKLEQAAISKPYVGRSDSIGTTQSFPGPPQAATPGGHAVSSPPPEAPTEFKPMAYNPAAPAAPEPIAHRDPTPPPADAESGTGLTAAAVHDHPGHGQQFPGGHQGPYAPQQTTHQPYMPGPPQRQSSFPPPPPATAGTPPVPGAQRTNTTSSFPPPPPPPSGSAGPSPGQTYAHSFAPPPANAATPSAPGAQRQTSAQYGQQPVTQYANYPGSPGHAPVQSPGLPPTPGHPPQSPGFAPASGYPAMQSPGHPPAGFSQYNYSGQQQAPADPYSYHNQVYRPTESELSHSDIKPHNPNQPPGRFDKVEKGVGRFLRKLDKKF